mgnify:FL=1|tara:strand:+ start:4 stop:867 length:864 start_codon:yes stop_codon:yes gene_type:complete
MNRNTPILRRDLDEGVLGEANIDGSIFIDKSVKKGSQQEKDIIAHESFHARQMKNGSLSYDDNSVTYKGKKYERKDGAIKYNGKFYIEGSEIFPWEQDANEAINNKYFKDYDYSELKKIKPPSSNSYDCMLEVKALNKIPLNKDFVKKHDDIEQAFKELAKNKNLKDYDKTVAAELIKESAPIILDLKNHFNRPRPKDIAVKMNITMQDVEMNSMKTMSYPSGHSAQAFLIAGVLGDQYPTKRDDFKSLAKKISYSRRVAHAHYKSDSKFGELLGKSMYKHIKNKQS